MFYTTHCQGSVELFTSISPLQSSLSPECVGCVVSYVQRELSPPVRESVGLVAQLEAEFVEVSPDGITLCFVGEVPIVQVLSGCVRHSLQSLVVGADVGSSPSVEVRVFWSARAWSAQFFALISAYLAMWSPALAVRLSMQARVAIASQMLRKAWNIEYSVGEDGYIHRSHDSGGVVQFFGPATVSHASVPRLRFSEKPESLFSNFSKYYK